MYVDDGLRAKLAPVLAAGRGVSADLARMGALLESARAEFYILSTPHSFPVEKYRWVSWTEEALFWVGEGIFLLRMAWHS